MCHDLQQYSNMIMSKLTRETVVLYSQSPGIWLWDDYKSDCDLILVRTLLGQKRVLASISEAIKGLEPLV